MKPAGRALIIGIGVTSPAGTGKDRFWDGLLTGASFAELLEWPELDVRAVACRIDDADLEGKLTTPERRRLDRIAHLAIVAADEAVADVGELAAVPHERRAIVVGIGFGGITTLTSQHTVLREHGARRLSPFGVPAAMPSSVASVLAIRFGVTGPASTLSSACASGTQAIGEAYRLLSNGAADLVITGGAEAPLDPLPIAAFARMDALTHRFDEPAAASRPFDRDRDGFVLGEGSAFYVLASPDAAAALGASVYGEIIGYSLSTDAYHLTAPDKEGGAAARCIQEALDDARLSMSDLSHLNTHGTSTKLNDAAEAIAITRCSNGSTPPLLAVKGAIGHLMGAAGAVELAASLLGAHRGLLPPTANFENADDGVELDISAESRAIDSGSPFLSTSFGFGGQNAAVVVTPETNPQTLRRFP